MSENEQMACALCDGPLSEDDIEGEHGACHACRTANTKPTLARVSLLIKLRGDLSQVPKWEVVRDIAGDTYGHHLSDRELLDRVLGFMQAETEKTTQAIMVMPMEEIETALKNRSSETTSVPVSYTQLIGKRSCLN